MPRTNETYAAVTASPLLNDAMRQIYWALWSYTDQGLTKGEIERYLVSQNVAKNPALPWHRQLGVMVKMGIMQRGSKRHCSVANKEDVTWLLTDLATPIRPRAVKPSAKKFLLAVAQMETMMAHHVNDGLLTPDLRALHAWLRDKVPDPKT